MSNGVRGQERGRAPSPAQGTVSPCPCPAPALPVGQAGLGRRKEGSPEGSGRESLGYSQHGVTGKDLQEQPQAGHGIIVRSLPTSCPAGPWFPGPGHPAGSLAMPRHVRSHCSGCEQSPCSPWGHTGTEGVGSSPGSDPISVANSDVTGSVPLVPRAQATTGR